jgi:nucleoside-diphosphate-sugar epimerase
MSKVKPDIVFHLASLFLAQHQIGDIDELVQSNIVFGTHLIEAMIANDIYKLVITGTSWQNMDNEEYNPVCLYAATKQAFETMITYYLKVTPLKVINLKLFDTYGPSDLRPKLFSLLRKAVQEQSSLLMSPGDQQIDLVYIDDVISAYCLCAERLTSDLVMSMETYAVSSDMPISLKNLVGIYEKIGNIKLDIHWGGRPYRSREVMVPWNKGMRVPGWKPRVTLEEGIRKLLNESNSEKIR